MLHYSNQKHAAANRNARAATLLGNRHSVTESEEGREGESEKERKRGSEKEGERRREQ